MLSLIPHQGFSDRGQNSRKHLKESNLIKIEVSKNLNKPGKKNASSKVVNSGMKKRIKVESELRMRLFSPELNANH